MATLPSKLSELSSYNLPRFGQEDEAQRIYLSHVLADLNSRLGQNQTIIVAASPPANPATGQQYFDTTLNQLGTWTGSIWYYGGGVNSVTAADTTVTITTASGAVTVKVNQVPTTLLTGTLQAAQFPALTGDVTTTAGTLVASVIKLQGVPVSNTAPTINQVLTYDGTQWIPAPSSGGGGAAGGDLAGTYPNPTVFQAHLTDQAAPAAPASGTLILASFNQQGFSVPHIFDAQGHAIEITRDNLVVTRNTSGSTIVKGTAVYMSGTSGFVPTVAPARANSASTMPCRGVMYEDTANNAFGRVLFIGFLENYNLSAFSNGDILYVSATTAGALTNIAPSTYPQIVATVINNGVGNGVLSVVPDRQSSIKWGSAASGDLSGTYPSPTVAKIQSVAVSSTTPTTNQVLQYNGSQWTPATLSSGPTQSQVQAICVLRAY